jgi:bile acid:Na+ symporter, BASS family
MKKLLLHLYQFLHQHLIWCLMAAYLLGTFWPQWGLWIRGIDVVSEANNQGGGWLLKAMLGLLLFNAGLGIDTRQIRQMVQCWRVLLAALILSVVAPLTIVVVVGFLRPDFLEPMQFYSLIMGMAIIAAMPVAGSSTAWSQNADGNLALSLGMVLFSTLLSPVSVWLVFHVLATFMPGAVSELLALFSARFVATFLILWIILPAASGVLVRWIIGAERTERIKFVMKFANLISLLVLNYTNAALSLPAMLQKPNAVYLSIVVILMSLLCFINFGIAEALSRFYRVDAAQRASLFFALGMTNNGAGLVLVSSASAVAGEILLPIIFYNLAQHLGAGIVDRFILRASQLNPQNGKDGEGI